MMNAMQILLLATLCFLSNAYGQSLSAQPLRQNIPQTSQAANQPVGSVEQGIGPLQAEIIALQEQNKLIKQYHSSLLDTVYWALGLLGAVATLIVGASWLVNFKLYDADKSRLIETFEGRTKELKAQLAADISASQASTSKGVQTQFESYADRASSEGRAVRTDLSTMIASVNSRLERIEGDIDTVKTGLSHQAREVESVQAVALEAEERIWDMQNIPINVVLTQAQVIASARKTNSAWRVEAAMERMSETLRKHFGAAPISGHSKKRAVDEVKLAQTFAPEKAQILLDLLAKVPEK